MLVDVDNGNKKYLPLQTLFCLELISARSECFPYDREDESTWPNMNNFEHILKM